MSTAGEDFREYTAAELAVSIGTLGLPAEPVEIEVQDPDGNVVATSLVRLHVGRGQDFDGTGGYQWTKLTARAEQQTAQPAPAPAAQPQAAPRIDDFERHVAEQFPFRPSGPDWETLLKAVAAVEAWKAAGIDPATAMKDIADAYSVAYIATQRAAKNLPAHPAAPTDVLSGMANAWVEGFMYGVLFEQNGGRETS